MLNANYANGAYTRKLAEVSAQSIVEIKITEDLGEPVAVYPQVSLTSAEAASGRVNYGGRLICTVVFSDGETLCRVQKGAEFSHHAESDVFAPAQSCNCALSCDRTSIKREGSACVITVVIGAKIFVCDRAERSYITDIEGAVTRREEGKLFSAVAFYGESEVDDDFSLVATDVLIPAAKPLVLNCEVKTGLIQVSGEICLSLLAVRDGQPVALDRAIPFKAEIPAEQAVMSSPANCRAEIKDMSLDCKVIEDKGKCDVTFVANLAFTGEYYEEEPASLVVDAFSTQNELGLTFGEESAEVCTDIKVYTERISGKCAAKARLDYTCAFLAAAMPVAEYSRTADGIEGSVNATLLYSQNAEIHSAQISLPFSVTLAGLNNPAAPLDVAVCGMSIRQHSEGECEGEAALKIAVCDGRTRTVRYVVSAEEKGPKPVDGSAISVYIPACGDGLWETAKKLNAPPEDIQKSNPDLNFPLNGTERILIFRGKK